MSFTYVWSYLEAIELWLKNASAVIALGTLVVNLFTFGAATKATMRIKNLEGQIDELKAELERKDEDIGSIDRIASLVHAIRNLHHADLRRNLSDDTIVKVRAKLTIPEDEELLGMLEHKNWSTTYIAFTHDGIHVPGEERISWDEFLDLPIAETDEHTLKMGDIGISRKHSAKSYGKLLRELQDQLQRLGFSPANATEKAA